MEHTFKMPRINFLADKWEELIVAGLAAREPATTLHLSDHELAAVSHSPSLQATIARLPAHAQGTERMVQLIKKVSGQVYGWERRHQTAKATVLSRAIRPSFKSKRNFRFVNVSNQFKRFKWVFLHRGYKVPKKRGTQKKMTTSDRLISTLWDVYYGYFIVKTENYTLGRIVAEIQFQAMSWGQRSFNSILAQI